MAAQPDIGTPLNRVDGILKVTGQARYANEHPAKDLLYGVVVSAGIARGNLVSIDASQARRVAGVIEIITHENRPHIPLFDKETGHAAAITKPPFKVLFDNAIRFSGQPIALVVADTFEAAREGAMRMTAQYAPAQHNTALEEALSEKFTPPKKKSANQVLGNPEAAFARAHIQMHGEYRLSAEYHNPIELHGSTVIWEGDGQITVYDKNQGSQNVRDQLASAFGLQADRVRVLNPFVGGAFGSGLRPSYQAYLAVLAALMLKRSIRVALTRQQMFTHVHRPACTQTVSLASNPDGRLAAMAVQATTTTSRFEDYTENVVSWGAMAYACEHTALAYTLAPVDTPTPGNMRAPGAATGMNLFEIAMDELAYAVDIDPLALRLVNYSDMNALRSQPYTSKALRSAYREGAARFGWDKRSRAPCSMSDGTEQIGWGVATGIWEAMMMKTTARATMDAAGVLQISSAASDIGTGTYTIMAQIAAGALGLPIERVQIELGDSRLPQSPLEGGSAMAASAGAAVRLACESLGKKLFTLVSGSGHNPLGEATLEQVEFADGHIRVKGNASHCIAYTQIVAMSGEPSIFSEATVEPTPDDQQEKSRNTHSAVFAEVKVDKDLGVIRVTRVVAAVAAGRIINPKTARSQILGGVVMGIGMALHEEAIFDHRLGRVMNHSLAEYHVPVQADIYDIDVIFVEEPDQEVSPLGVKGVGEIGIVGTAAAIANAVFHATGKRIRHLPITLDKLLS
jgi:xanthine dehydrogenase YagR molybdenum-binding subunit